MLRKNGYNTPLLFDFRQRDGTLMADLIARTSDPLLRSRYRRINTVVRLGIVLAVACCVFLFYWSVIVDISREYAPLVE